MFNSFLDYSLEILEYLANDVKPCLSGKISKSSKNNYNFLLNYTITWITCQTMVQAARETDSLFNKSLWSTHMDSYYCKIKNSVMPHWLLEGSTSVKTVCFQSY
ncbi:hypothetical protein BpHYR1_013067 [Brachionus plicatilis]|uniref:Uncharacterized protein n=1 Tax=Brachionus plicatilis TaxID=10195 RepID=A0A3M7RTU9_BRAPC|nr:hypothetical protein BpHYR1_013067 [Brachionus plicatilis]